MLTVSQRTVQELLEDLYPYPQTHRSVIDHSHLHSQFHVHAQAQIQAQLQKGDRMVEGAERDES